MKPKDQRLAEGWPPILITTWSQNSVTFERQDYAWLRDNRPQIDQEQLEGDEPAVMISHLHIRNESPVPQTVRYYIRPWKTLDGLTRYGPPLANRQNAWQTGLRGDCVTAMADGAELAVCYVDGHGKGALTLTPSLQSACYSVELAPTGEHVVHTVVPGWATPVSESPTIPRLDYDRIRGAVAGYWKTRLAEGMQVTIPEPHLQNIYNASLHHFLMALTKDRRRGEYYASAAMLRYGAIGSESSPIIQALDMRGRHDLAEKCLEAFLSSQGEMMTAGDYVSKEGGFYRFWPGYTIDQGTVLWALAEDYLFTRNQAWLSAGLSGLHSPRRP